MATRCPFDDCPVAGKLATDGGHSTLDQPRFGGHTRSARSGRVAGGHARPEPVSKGDARSKHRHLPTTRHSEPKALLRSSVLVTGICKACTFYCFLIRHRMNDVKMNKHAQCGENTP